MMQRLVKQVCVCVCARARACACVRVYVCARGWLYAPVCTKHVHVHLHIPASTCVQEEIARQRQLQTLHNGLHGVLFDVSNGKKVSVAKPCMWACACV